MQINIFSVGIDQMEGYRFGGLDAICIQNVLMLAFLQVEVLPLSFCIKIKAAGHGNNQGRAHDYRGAGAHSQKRAVLIFFFSGHNNTICRLI